MVKLVQQTEPIEIITPEKFGAGGKGKTDDTGAVQAAFDEVVRTRGYLRMIGMYRVTDTLRLESATKYPVDNVTIEMPINANNSLWPKGLGINYDGPAGKDIVFIDGLARSTVSLVAHNITKHTDLRGVVIGNHKTARGKRFYASNFNRLSFGVRHCSVGAQLGDYSRTGVLTNCDDNLIDQTIIGGCETGLLLDSIRQDNNVFGFFHSTGQTMTKTQRHAIEIRGAGNGTVVHNGFARVDHITDGRAAVHSNSTFSCNRFSLEGIRGDDQCRALHIDCNVSRDQSVIQNFCAQHRIGMDGKVAYVRGKGGFVFVGCRWKGEIERGDKYTKVVEVGVNEPTSSNSTKDDNVSITADQLVVSPGVINKLSPVFTGPKYWPNAAYHGTFRLKPDATTVIIAKPRNVDESQITRIVNFVIESGDETVQTKWSRSYKFKDGKTKRELEPNKTTIQRFMYDGKNWNEL